MSKIKIIKKNILNTFEALVCQQANPCLNDGICMPTSETTGACLCSSNFTGYLCEYNSPCIAGMNPCQNDAACLPIIFYGKPPVYECQCRDGFAGNNCQTNLNTQCTPNFCQNGGTCFIDTITLTSKCSCLPLFTGNF